MPSSVQSLSPPLPSASPSDASSAAREAAGGGGREGLKHLSALLTHRLSTLTSTISGYADLMVDTPSVQEQRQIAMNVLEATTEIDDLLAGLRHYSRPLQPVRQPVAVSKIVRGVVALLDAPAARRVELEGAVAAPRVVDVDPQLLRQALLGLLHNALEASAPQGPVRFDVALASPESDDAPAATFAVWNEGTIDFDDAQHVFRPFWTSHARRLGLGLPIARDIAEQHGGALRLSSNDEERGTCFALHL